jgi:predicted MFS family arabinose efflux permease
VRPGRHRALLGFAAFGAFWGAWGAELPAVRAHAGVDDAQLGLALLCVGAGALGSMRATGALVDRLGARVLPISVAAFGAAALLPALARGPLALAAALLVLGAVSGAFDVAVNAEGVGAEAVGPRVLNLGHAAFSAAVVAGSLVVGALRAAGAPPLAVLGTVAVALVVAAIVLSRLPAAPHAVREARAGLRVPRPLAILGALAAVAYFVENAWQSWSALQLDATLGAPAAVAALGPAVFAGAAATGRLLGNRVAARVADRALLRAGAALAAAGSLIAALAPATGVALAGIALAGLGTSVCAPTLISLAGRIAGPGERGAAISTVITIAYLGFVVGPAAVGIASDAATLRAALAGVGGLALVLAAAARVAPTASVGSRA